MFDIVFMGLTLVAVSLIFILYIIYSYSFIKDIKAPYVPLPRKALEAVVKTMAIKSNDVVYDLGCGDGRVLMACFRNEPEAKYIGLDKSLIAITLAKINLIINKNLNIKIRRGNIFKENLTTATCIYMYLYPKILDQLESKLEKELASGTRVISCSFPLKNRQPVRMVNLGENNRLVKKIFVYQF
ncbi:MAG: methyltransferase domain-containing protein [bacterium]|nr:methyltransferase domain-containing protein [bacterium]